MGLERGLRTRFCVGRVLAIAKLRLEPLDSAHELPDGQDRCDEPTSAIPRDGKHGVGKYVPEEHTVNEGFPAPLPSHLAGVFFQVGSNELDVLPVLFGAEPGKSS